MAFIVPHISRKFHFYNSTNMSTCKKECRPKEENQSHANLSLPHSPSLFAQSSSDDIQNPQHCQADYSRREWLFPNRRVSKLSISLEAETESMENEEGADSNNNNREQQQQQRKTRKKVRFDRICERVEWDNYYCDAPPQTARDQREILGEWDGGEKELAGRKPSVPAERATAAHAGSDEEGEEIEMVAKEENGLCLQIRYSHGHTVCLTHPEGKGENCKNCRKFPLFPSGVC
ncbi:hypothetical protein GPALN_007929 [Globodera pallida]|nr:hypothetical protein GPALN_007929 [Globodera pallida]